MFRTGIALLFLAALGIGQPMIVKTSTLIDGKGHVLTSKEIVIEGGRITGIADATHRPTLDLSGYTVMPGWIDTHVHITWFFNKDGRLESGPSRTSTAQEAWWAAVENVQATLMGGFTTVQSVGAQLDGQIRDLTASGALSGPRILTSLVQITSGTPEQIRATVQREKAAGADLVKLFATASIREGGRMTLTVEQINAACGEAKAQGLRTIVHAHSTEGAPRFWRAARPSNTELSWMMKLSA
jgi:imidazolonepropionase-like amidohydrolase